MSQFYFDETRENDPHALPNGETFYVGTVRHWKDPLDCHICNNWAEDQKEGHSEHIGWYWQSGFPGCMPDGDPIGPFDTEEDALEDAREGME